MKTSCRSSGRSDVGVGLGAGLDLDRHRAPRLDGDQAVVDSGGADRAVIGVCGRPPDVVPRDVVFRAGHRTVIGERCPIWASNCAGLWPSTPFPELGCDDDLDRLGGEHDLNQCAAGAALQSVRGDRGFPELIGDIDGELLRASANR